MITKTLVSKEENAQSVVLMERGRDRSIGPNTVKDKQEEWAMEHSILPKDLFAEVE